MHRFNKIKSRADGSTLVEMLIVAMTMSFVSAAAAGMLLLLGGDGLKMQNKVDNTDETRKAIELFNRIVRQGIQFGELYGNSGTPPYNTLPNCTQFPTIYNPVYGAGQAPLGGWGTWADNSSGNQVYTLSNQTLVVQRPVIDSASGYPCAIDPSYYQNSDPPLYAQNGQNGTNGAINAITDIFRVVPDPQNPGEYLLQWMELPGWVPNGSNPLYNYAYTAQTMLPTTIAKGIIGPLDASGQPRIFQYVEDVPPGPPASRPVVNDNVPDPNNIAFYRSVIVNLEIKNHNNTASGVNKACTLAYKTTVYLRN